MTTPGDVRHRTTKPLEPSPRDLAIKALRWQGMTQRATAAKLGISHTQVQHADEKCRAWNAWVNLPDPAVIATIKAMRLGWDRSDPLYKRALRTRRPASLQGAA